MKITRFLFPLLLAAAAPSMIFADAPATLGPQCASCHGKDGAGHTKAGRLLAIKDLNDPAYQKTFTDEQAEHDLKEGLTKDGKTKMKPFAGKLTADEIKALVAYVRTLVPH